LEAEVARLNDPRVNRSDGDLVNLVPFDAIKIHRTDGRQFRASFGPRKPHRLEPRMIDRNNAVLFGDLALEELGLRALD